ncbi:MAG: HAD family hydrolase [Planctomycetes bacterium]|nr:HAD family hydrolase [Planctomycetota bacterium]
MRNLAVFKAIIFDLDGTLVDTLADLAGAMNWALGQLGEDTHSLDACRKMIGNGIVMFAKRALAPEKQHLRSGLLELMKTRYGQHCFAKSSVYPGVNELIVKLGQMGIRLAVATNKEHDDAVKIVEHFFAQGTFEIISGVRQNGPVKPDPAFAEAIMAKMALASDDFVVIGDSDVDIATAKSAQMLSVGVTWGFRSREDLAAAGADIIIDKPEEIFDLLT